MIFTNNEYIRTIMNYLDGKPSSVWISTYNLHVGISRTGSVYDKSIAHKLLAQIEEKTKDSRVMVGFSDEGFHQYRNRLTNVAEFFPKINWRCKIDSHLKCWIFFYGSRRNSVAIAGGRNLGDSEWADLSIVLTTSQTRQLIVFYDQLWLTSKRINTTSEFTVTDGKK